MGIDRKTLAYKFEDLRKFLRSKIKEKEKKS